MNVSHELGQFKMVTKAEAAQVFSVCTKTIDNYIKEGLLPHPVAFGSREYWHPTAGGDSATQKSASHRIAGGPATTNLETRQKAENQAKGGEGTRRLFFS